MKNSFIVIALILLLISPPIVVFSVTKELIPQLLASEGIHLPIASVLPYLGCLMTLTLWGFVILKLLEVYIPKKSQTKNAGV